MVVFLIVELKSECGISDSCGDSNNSGGGSGKIDGKGDDYDD